MNKIWKLGNVILALSILFIFLVPISFATQAITRAEEMIRKTMKQNSIPVVSAASIAPDEISFYSFGKQSVSQNSLFCIGSLSKSFTGFAILYLEETEKLSLDDPITKYIPWFEANFQGENIASSITISDLLYQTSGLTNNEKDFPNATASMNLEENIKNLSNRELAFLPSSQFAYANANYNMLGYIIEQITGTSYADFMEQHIFIPLNLTNTFALPTNERENLIIGSRLSFGQARKYDLPISSGAVPAGYILSCTEDLSRWLQIQLENIEVPEAYQKVIQKSHIANPNSIIDENTCYAVGWYVDNNSGLIYHSGGTPNYSSRLVIDPTNNNASCVLTNINLSANTDDMTNNLISLFNDDREMSYRLDIWTIVDRIFSIICIISLCIAVTLILIFIQKKKHKKSMREAWYLLPILMTLFAVMCILLLPFIFNSSWHVLLIWTPLSMITSIVLLLLIAFLSAFCIHRFRKTS